VASLKEETEMFMSYD